MIRGRKYSERQLSGTLQIGTITDSWGSTATGTSFAYDTVNTVKCFEDLNKSGEVSDGSHVALVDAMIYVPIGTAIDSTQRLKVTHTYHKALSAVRVYGVVGQPKEARNLLLIHVRLETGGSER